MQPELSAEEAAEVERLVSGGDPEWEDPAAYVPATALSDADEATVAGLIERTESAA